MSSHAERLTEIVDLVLEAARRAGASDADAVGIAWTQSAAQVRLGEVETVTMSRERRLGLRCFDGNASAVASTADLTPAAVERFARDVVCLLYTSPSPRDKRQSRMPSSA